MNGVCRLREASLFFPNEWIHLNNLPLVFRSKHQDGRKLNNSIKINQLSEIWDEKNFIFLFLLHCFQYYIAIYNVAIATCNLNKIVFSLRLEMQETSQWCWNLFFVAFMCILNMRFIFEEFIKISIAIEWKRLVWTRDV